MADPTFDSVALTTDGAKNVIRSSQARAYIETLPGVNGAYMQAHGTGARPIIATGIYKVSGQETAIAALQALTAAFRVCEAKVDGETIGSYVSTDGVTYGYCLLQSYNHGQMRTCTVGSTYSAYMTVTAQLIQLDPSSITVP